MTYFYKMNNGLTPGYLSSLVPNTLRIIHDHNTRHSTLIPPVGARTTLFANYVLPQTVSLGIFFRIATKSCPINVFKSRLNLNRLGQLFHTRIRMGCNALNSDLFRKNIVNSPRCTCGTIETPTHFLLHCFHYNIPRQRHIFALNLSIPLSTELLLVGSNELTINQNTEIFLSVQKFILSSKRFTL